MTEAEIAEKWLEISKAERARVKKRDGGKVPDNPKNQYSTSSKKSVYDPRMDKTRSYNPERYDQILNLVKKGLNNREIGRQLGISDTSVRYWKKRYNMK